MEFVESINLSKGYFIKDGDSSKIQNILEEFITKVK